MDGMSEPDSGMDAATIDMALRAEPVEDGPTEGQGGNTAPHP
jgi:hypothetical protein